MSKRGPHLLGTVSVLLVLTAAVMAGDDVETQDRDPHFVSGELLIRFRRGCKRSHLSDFYRTHRLSEKEDLDTDPRDGDPGVKVVEVAVERTKVLAQELTRDPRVRYVEHNYVLFAAVTPADPRFSQLYGLHNTGQTGGAIDADIDAVEAWDITTGSAGVLVAVIDTGVNYNHEDLAANMWNNPGEIEGNGIDDDGNGVIDDIHGFNSILDTGDPMDDNSHGTHVAGTIGAVGNNGVGVTGVNWTVGIIACKFLDASGSGSTANAIKCFQYLNRLKRVQGRNIRVTNNSWGGGGFSQALRDAMQGLDQPGMAPILHCVAAGNSFGDNDISPEFPANYDLLNIVSVAATDHNDVYASFTNYGATTVDLAAPGVNILSTSIPGNSYSVKSGTSMATPHVAGAAALIWSNSPALSAADVKGRLLSGANAIGSIGSNASRPTLTNARLNVANTLETDSVPPAPVTDLAAAGTTAGSVTLTWTATGDDGLLGTAGAYDIRYSTLPLTEATWATAGRASGEPAPKPSGSSETFVVAGLAPDTTYHIGLKVRDNRGNESPLANTVIAVTGPSGAGPQTVTLQVAGGWDAGSERPLSKLSVVRQSDDSRFRVDAGSELSLEFDATVPANAFLTSVKVFIEHYEHSEIGSNNVVWLLGTGSLQDPSLLGFIQPPLQLGAGNEVLQEWDVTALVASAAQANDLKVVIRNMASKRDTNIDHAFVEVAYTFQPPVLTAITVSPASTSILIGETQAFTATGTLSDGSTADLTDSAIWTSSNAAVATIDIRGVATGHAAGSTLVRALKNGIVGSPATLTVSTPSALVSIAVTPATASILLGATQQFTATGTFGDGSTRDLAGAATWTSSNPGTATIAAGGLATALAAGTTSIRAALDGVQSPVATLQVTAAVPETVTLRVTDGFESKSGKTLVEQNQVSEVRTNNDRRIRVDSGRFLTLQFEQLVPANATILEVKVSVEHFEAGSTTLAFQAGTGPLPDPTLIDSISPPLLIGEGSEAVLEWVVTGFDAAQANDLKLAIRNMGTNGNETFIDRVFAQVTFQRG